MDRTAMGYRDAATTSPLGSSNEDYRRPAVAGGEYRDRPAMQHRRPEGMGKSASSSNANRGIQTVNLQTILQGAREAIIDFDGAAYRLRITRNHRLILTK